MSSDKGSKQIEIRIDRPLSILYFLVLSYYLSWHFSDIFLYWTVKKKEEGNITARKLNSVGRLALIKAGGLMGVRIYPAGSFIITYRHIFVFVRSIVVYLGRDKNLHVCMF